MLDEFLANQINVRIYKMPFPHIVVDNLFSKDFYALMCKEFNSKLNLGLSQKFSKSKFYKFPHYNAYACLLNPNTEISNLFYSMPWRHWVNKFFNIKLTKNMLSEFHHHLPESGDGYIHNDYELVSFMRDPLQNGINPHRHQIDYRGRIEGSDVYCVRSIAMLYYFNNPKWQEGNGGETALYDNWKEGSEPVEKVAPLNNRLLAFEVSPKSFHGFLSNVKNVRNAMAMWLHSSENYMETRYVEKAK